MNIVRQHDIVERNGQRGTVYQCEPNQDEDGEESYATVFVRWLDGGSTDVCESEFYPSHKEVSGVNDDGTAWVKYEDVYDYKVVTPKCFLNVYLHDRNYGGPEEGGWWYDTLEPVEESCQRFATEEEAQAHLEQAEAEAKQDNSERRSDIGSVLSEGKFEVRLEAWPGEYEPKQRPRFC